jgi:hypothetical protein
MLPVWRGGIGRQLISWLDQLKTEWGYQEPSEGMKGTITKERRMNPSLFPIVFQFMV